MGKKKVIATTAIGIFLGFGLATGAHADYIDNRQTNQETRIQQGLDSGSLTTSVQTKPMGINAREARQQGRIRQGIKSGELTRGEVKHLEKEQGRIRAEEARFKSDGQFTPRERAKVQHDLNHSNRHIYNAKHNGRSR